MKTKSFTLAFLVFVFSLSLFAQEQIKLTNISKPGDAITTEKTGIVLAKNLLGPHKMIFFGNAPGKPAPVLSKEERGKSGGKSSFDTLATLYSGKIHSSNIAEPIMFENKTAEELVLLEIPIFPTTLEQPFDLYLDLKIQAVSKPKSDKSSDDAGEYSANLNITLVKL